MKINIVLWKLDSISDNILALVYPLVHSIYSIRLFDRAIKKERERFGE